MLSDKNMEDDKEVKHTCERSGEGGDVKKGEDIKLEQ